MTWTTTREVSTRAIRPYVTMILFSAFALAAGALPARADALTNVLEQCRELSVDSERLACYDRETAGLAKAAPVRTEEPPAAVAPETFGTKGSAVARAQEQERPKEPEMESITAVVTSITTRARGERVFVLDNGQTWAEKEAARYLPVKVGDQIQIDTGALGSYRLRHASGRSTKVTRIE
jgi:hypothetical protein